MPALTNHKNTKHYGPQDQTLKKQRGRPRKYDQPKNPVRDPLVSNFFNAERRRKIEGETYNISDIVKLVFDDIYVRYSSKCLNQLINFTDNPVLQKLFNESDPNDLPKVSRKADDIFYEYLHFAKDQVNKNYFILLMKFILLFRECINISQWNKTEDTSNHVKKEYTITNNAEAVPDFCNEFVTEYLENNDWFGIESQTDRNEIIELVQNFCHWLYTNSYTQSRLTKVA
jgi:hypothetical protein